MRYPLVVGLALLLGVLAGGFGARALHSGGLSDGPAQQPAVLQSVQVRPGGTATRAGGPREPRVAPDRAGAASLLPDLAQEVPQDLAVVRRGRGENRGFRLVFASAAANVGRGPLVVEGRREDRGQEHMVAEQLVRRADGSTGTHRGVGRLVYVRSPDHDHWHLLPFMSYELRPLTRASGILADSKTGFCLGDRYISTIPLAPGSEPAPGVFTSRCGLGRPGLRRVRQGISVGHGDDYPPLLEGQYLDITEVPSGEYELVHRVNRGRALRESSHANNAASLALRLTWRAGEPRVRVLRACPGSARCAATP